MGSLAPPVSSGPMMLKGSALLSTVGAIETVFGKTAVVAVRAAMDPTLRKLLDEEPVLPIRWYPVELFAALHASVKDLLGHGDWHASHAIGMAAAKHDFGNLYAIILRAVNAQTVWTRMERMWTMYNSRGSFVWRDLKPGYMHAIIRDVGGYNPGMWNAVAGRGQQLLLMTGVKGADVRVVRSTETTGEFEGMWLE